MQRTITNELGMQFNEIPAGRAFIGSHRCNPARIDDKEEQALIIPFSFFLGRTVVTQSEYLQLMSDNPSRFRYGGNYPVERVNWVDITTFTRRLSLFEGDGKFVYRLPTEMEWEYACRAGSEYAYFFGDDAKDLEDCAWFINNSDGRTHEVGQKKPNAWGLFDMHGLVSEWVLDPYQSRGVITDYETTRAQYGGVRRRVYRGGSWRSGPESLRCGARNALNEQGRQSYISFRLVCQRTTEPIQLSIWDVIRRNISAGRQGKGRIDHVKLD